MTSRVQLRRRIDGATGAPATANMLEGELALNFPGAAGTTTKPELWAFDGSGWRRVNPDVTITTQSITFGAGADIGAAYTAWFGASTANRITGNVVIATYGAPAQAYVLTNAAAPQTAASWTSLGGAVAYATAAEIHAGVDTTKALNSAILRGETVAAPTGGAAAVAGDADKLIRLGATGQIAAAFLPAVGAQVRAAVDATQAFAQPGAGGNYASGDIVFSSAGGTVGAGWTGVTGATVKSGDSLVFDGTNWHLLPNTLDLNAYLALAGGTMGDGAKVTFDITTGGAGTVVIDAAGGTVDQAVIDGGTY